jgi:2-dehydropantoate 2-reductase
MKVVVYGAGAIGGTVGAFMAKAGQDVVLVDKVKDHVDQMNARGLRFTGILEETISVRAILPEQMAGPMELVFLAVKSQDTNAALDALIPRLGPRGTLVSLQNGINPPHIAERIGRERVVAAFVHFSADYHGPGLIMRGSEGHIYLGELDGRITDRLKRIGSVLAPVCGVHLTDNIFGYLWAKQAFGCYATIGAMVNADKEEVLTHEKYKDLLVEAARECARVATADRVKLEAWDVFDARPFAGDSREDMFKAFHDLAVKDLGNLKRRTGLWRDLAVRKRKTEVPSMTGYVIARGKALGIPTPVNEAAMRMITEIEDGKRSMGWHNLDELNEVLRKR